MKPLQLTILLLCLRLSISLSAKVGRKSAYGDLGGHKKVLNDCRTQTAATQADLEAFKMRKIPSTKTGRCMVQCIFDSAKIMEGDKFNKNGMVVALAPALKGDVMKLGKLKQLSEVCDREIGTGSMENCEGPTKIVECLAKHGSDYGLSFNK